MDLIEEIKWLLTESTNRVELKPILLPSRQLAQIIAGFSNSGGGHIVLGAKWKSNVSYEVSGISMDFNATSITHKAVESLSPKPIVKFGYHLFDGIQTFIISISASSEIIILQGKTYVRQGGEIIDLDEEVFVFNPGGEVKIRDLSVALKGYSHSVTLAKSKIIAHYQSSLKIIDNLGNLLYPQGIVASPISHEGRILTRILFSSIVDNFEIYLSDLLYEIWLSNPNTLKSNTPVTMEQILKCADIEEFVIWYAKDKISKMKKGSVKTFIKENIQISELRVFDDEKITKVEAILQIRHLFSHSNGIIDDQFFKYYNGDLPVGTEYTLSIDNVLDKLWYLADTINLLDEAAIKKYSLSTI